METAAVVFVAVVAGVILRGIWDEYRREKIIAAWQNRKTKTNFHG